MGRKEIQTMICIRSKKTGGVSMFRIHKSITAFVAFFALFLDPNTPVLAQTVTFGTGHPLKVMTRNVYQGTDFVEVMSSTDFSSFLQQVTLTINNVRATKPDVRMAAIADQIADEEPDVLGIQEATIWRTGPSPYALTTEYDMLQLLLDGLKKNGTPYVAVKVVPQFVFTAPSSTGMWVSTTTQIAILVRADLLRSGEATVTDSQGGLFPPEHTLTIPLPAIGEYVAVNRGWASVDLNFKGTPFRFVTAHPEAFAWQYDAAQVGDLLGTPTATSLPVVMAADFNIQAQNPSDPTYLYAYNAITLLAGFTDAWIASSGPLPGFTCCQLNDLKNVKSQIVQRIDLIFVRGDVAVRGMKITDAKPDARIQGLWPSDHAGVVGKLWLLE
jgi:endonuclease/exonuclease/phosphatase family metal-dependent hydrolase